jgi:hypothetical protein
MVYLKSCPRCRGDVFTEHDLRERYLTCLQCGHVLTSQEESKLRFCGATWLNLARPRQPRAA